MKPYSINDALLKKRQTFVMCCFARILGLKLNETGTSPSFLLKQARKASCNATLLSWLQTLEIIIKTTPRSLVQSCREELEKKKKMLLPTLRSNDQESGFPNPT